MPAGLGNGAVLLVRVDNLEVERVAVPLTQVPISAPYDFVDPIPLPRALGLCLKGHVCNLFGAVKQAREFSE